MRHNHEFFWKKKCVCMFLYIYIVLYLSLLYLVSFQASTKWRKAHKSFTLNNNDLINAGCFLKGIKYRQGWVEKCFLIFLREVFCPAPAISSVCIRCTFVCSSNKIAITLVPEKIGINDKILYITIKSPLI